MATPSTCPRCGAVLERKVARGLCPQCLLELGRRGDPGRTRSGVGAYQPPPIHELAPKFPAFEILGLIGQGGMGAVYRARHRELERDVALKILRPEIAQDPGLIERFTREAKALARLNHPGIVSVHDFGVTDGTAYVVMEYVDGPNLRQLLRAGKLPAEEALVLVPQICDALQYAHDEGVIHRDVKPENVLLDASGRVKMADFGLAKLTDPSAHAALTSAGQILGTPHYMAPEQLGCTKDVDHRADIYSLGIVLYELLTGELPMGRFDPPSKKVAVDVRLDEVVLRSLESEPARRYQRASDVSADLHRVATTDAPLVDDGRRALDEDLVGLILTIACLAFVGLGLVVGQRWWAVLALYIPGMIVGSCMVCSTLTRQDRQVALAILFAAVTLIGYGIWSLESTQPLWGLLSFTIGLGHGMDEQRRKEKKQEA